MGTQTATSASRGGFPQASRKHGRWNYVWHTAEGGIYMGGAAFVAMDTVLPNMVNSFGGSEWLIALTPLLTTAGVMAPQLLVSHRIEKMSAVHRYTLIMGLFQRLPFLMGAIGFFVFGNSLPVLALALALFAPLLSGIFAGIGIPAWKELISRTVPPERRASMYALRNTIGAAIGLLAGWMIHTLLGRFSGYDGYALLFLITFVLLMVSWLAFKQLREVPLPERSQPNTGTLLDSFRQLPALVRKDRQLFYMSVSSALFQGLFIIIPFAAVLAIQGTGRGEAFVGLLVIAKTCGLFAGNILAGYLGDTRGGRLPLLIASGLALLFCLAIPSAKTEWALLVLFCVYGCAFAMHMVGNQVLILEISPDGRRPTYIGIISAVTFVGIVAVPVVSSLIRQLSSQIWPLSLAAFLFLFIGLVCIYRIEEPRQRTSL